VKPRRTASVLIFLLGVGGVAEPLRSELYIWVDPEGHTHVTDDLANVPGLSPIAAPDAAHRSDLWSGRITGPEPQRSTRGPRTQDEERIQRLLRGAIEDLGRGETGRAIVALEGVLALEPARPEAHWYLALLDRQRGRFEMSEAHLRSFLAQAGEQFEPWRQSAQRRLQALVDERRLAEEQAADGPLRLVALESPRFRVHYDRRLGEASPDYARTVVQYLEEAHALGRERLGVVPQEPTGVVLYAKAAYLAAHRDRFSFPTVGFFDGRIHVVSAAHPAGELRALLFHEFSHALFREHTGGDRPFWLNEGLAKLAERASRRQEAVTRSERARLRRVMEADGWLPLSRLATGFEGLDEEAARQAYLESTVAVAWLEQRLDTAARARLLSLLGRGAGADQALRQVADLDVAGLDGAVRADIVAEFPTLVP
jgi:hypothetical protein